MVGRDMNDPSPFLSILSHVTRFSVVIPVQRVMLSKQMKRGLPVARMPGIFCFHGLSLSCDACKKLQIRVKIFLTDVRDSGQSRQCLNFQKATESAIYPRHRI